MGVLVSGTISLTPCADDAAVTPITPRSTAVPPAAILSPHSAVTTGAPKLSGGRLQVRGGRGIRGKCSAGRGTDSSGRRSTLAEEESARRTNQLQKLPPLNQPK